jgi:hypothetical protein
MHARRFSKAVAAAILAISVLATGSTAPAGAATDKDKASSHQTKKLDTGWG